MWQTESPAVVLLWAFLHGNGQRFAMELGLPANDLERCWEIVQAGNVRLVDLPSANGKYFVQLGGIGLDAQAVKETTLAFKRSLGPLSILSPQHTSQRANLRSF